MKRAILPFLAILKLTYCFISVSIYSANASELNSSKHLTIFTEPSLSVAMTKIARQYSKQYDVVTSISFNSPDNLIGDIDMGEAADVFITANDDVIESLKLKGLVDIYNIVEIGQDSLNLVTSNENNKIPPILYNNDNNLSNSLKILNSKKVTLILDNYSSSSGKIGGELIKKLNLNDFKLFTKITEDRSPITTSITNNDNYYSLLLTSQIYNNKNIKIIARSDARLDDMVARYKILIIAGNNMNVARQFLNFINNKKAKEILKSSGISTN